MSVYQRYFRFTSGPVADEIDRLQDLRVVAAVHAKKVADQVGGEFQTWQHSGGFAGFTFKETPCQNTFRLLKKHRLWVPRKNTPEGKALWAEIELVPLPDPIDSALKLVGLTPNAPSLFNGSKWYAPTMFGYGKPTGVWFARIPWLDADPDKMAQYKVDRAGGGRCDSNLEHLQWEAPADWVEVKSWQVEKESEEINAQKSTATDPE